MLARAEEEKQVVPGAELEVRFFQFFNPTSKRKREIAPRRSFSTSASALPLFSPSFS